MADAKKKSFIASKNFLLWTGWYFVASYLIFLGFFGFNLLSPAAWQKIPNIALHGFGGLTFGMALIAWIPIWLAGSMAIAKTGKPILSFAKKEEPKKEVEEESAPQEKQPEINFPDAMPEEMRVPYARMMRGQLARGAMDCKVIQKNDKAAALSAECKETAPASAKAMAGKPEEEMMLPDSFDMETPDSGNVPQFREITFGDPLPAPDIPASAQEIKIETRKGKKFAIATHDDPDFWIADSENWFATGKQKPSPVETAIAAAAENDATPVLLLASENIMDLDAQRKKWVAAGVVVVKDLEEL
ncbi:MAG: hypothetical protein FWF97_03615 [Alphaproteobacteria bacterium]|nr:hypothetical protein [Alphaproteobacteria bacterium]